jgi:hypothetical protein
MSDDGRPACVDILLPTGVEVLQLRIRARRRVVMGRRMSRRARGAWRTEELDAEDRTSTPRMGPWSRQEREGLGSSVSEMRTVQIP